MASNKYFKLYANCIPVKGANRSVICDLQKGKIHFIPNDLFEILTNFDAETVSGIKLFYKNEFDTTIDEYFDYLEQLDVGFYTSHPNRYPKLNDNWYSPFEITHAIIDIDHNNYDSVFSSLEQLERLNCQYTQIRFLDEFDLKHITGIVSFLDKRKSFLRSIQFIFRHCKNISLDALKSTIASYPRIASLLIYGAPKDEFMDAINGKSGFILFSAQNEINKRSCGIIDPSYFTVNIKNYTESRNHNSCLHGKISIDAHGNIRNCPSMPQSFGNIKNTTLEEALNHKDFKKYWNITKDQVLVCKDCEFRYICTDCRAYLDNPEDEYSKPLKCGYNPYTNTWEDWSANPLKQKAIAIYGMRDLV